MFKTVIINNKININADNEEEVIIEEVFIEDSQ